jgi:thiamine monophosphate synthase
VYELQDGLLRELGLSAANSGEAEEAYRAAVDYISEVFGTTGRGAPSFDSHCLPSR